MCTKSIIWYELHTWNVWAFCLDTFNLYILHVRYTCSLKHALPRDPSCYVHHHENILIIFFSIAYLKYVLTHQGSIFIVYYLHSLSWNSFGFSSFFQFKCILWQLKHTVWSLFPVQYQPFFAKGIACTEWESNLANDARRIHSILYLGSSRKFSIDTSLKIEEKCAVSYTSWLLVFVRFLSNIGSDWLFSSLTTKFEVVVVVVCRGQQIDTGGFKNRKLVILRRNRLSTLLYIGLCLLCWLDKKNILTKCSIIESFFSNFLDGSISYL